MRFNWIHLLRQTVRSVAGVRGTHRRLTRHRITVLVVFWVLFIPHQVVTHLCLLLDHVVFPGWHRRTVVRPLFIVGPFRSGTTFLHRLLAADEKTFTAMRTWEIYLAPSIIQRRLLYLWKRLDAVIGAPAYRWLRRFDERFLGKVQFHHVSLWREEEDEGLFLYLWDSLFTWFFFPDTAGIADYMYADVEMKPTRQRRKLAFYRRLLQRHLYCHPESSFYLSKNPALTPKVASLRQTFPDARFIYLLRNPERVLISQATWFSFCWRYFASPLEEFPFRDELVAMATHWYAYPRAVFERWSPEEYVVLGFEELTGSPLQTVESIYRRFQMPLTDEYRERIGALIAGSEGYGGGNRRTLTDIGYTPEEIPWNEWNAWDQLRT